MSRFTLPALEEELRQAVAPEQGLSPQVRRALVFAYEAHGGQYREHKDSQAEKIPYIAHPVGVAKLANSLLSSAHLNDTVDDILSACLTHDVLEDTKVTLGQLGTATSARTADIVLALTKPEVTGRVSRAERNRSFLAQIVNAGATACFVKVCDAIHNLSRPHSMPDELLLKTLRKASNDYLPLTDSPGFEPSIRRTYEDVIRSAELVARSSRSPRAPAALATFEEALSFCVERAQSKVLEEHDIAMLIEKVAPAPRAYIGTVEGFIQLYAGDPTQPERIKARQLMLSRAPQRQFTLPAAALGSATLDEMRIEQILGCTFQPQEDPATARYLFVAADRDASGWLTSKTLLALVSILAERLRDRDARRLAQVAEELIHLELPLDASLVQKAQLTHDDLVILKSNIDMATFVHHNLLAGLKKLAARPELHASVDHVESRVKAPKSIVQKLLTRRFRSVEQLNDFVGARIIVGSTEAQARMYEVIAQELQSSTSELSRAIPIVAHSLETEEVCSPEGYKAIHIRFHAVTPSRSLGSVACEIQLRTLFQDAWARLSQMLLYKKGADRNRERMLLSQVGELRDECDRVISGKSKT